MESWRNLESGSYENDDESNGAYDSDLVVDGRIKTPSNISNSNLVAITFFPLIKNDLVAKIPNLLVQGRSFL